MKKVILLFGGESSEHEISCQSAKFIYDYIDVNKYDLIPIGISKNGNWYYYEDSDFVNWDKDIQLKKVNNIVEELKSSDIVFNIIHGKYGEDGRIQSLLELFKIPYVGCDSKTSMVCMDKEYTKIFAKNYNIPIINYEVLNDKNIRKRREYPLIVKPANGGSSIGINVVNNKKELNQAYNEALKHDGKVIVEDYIMAREFEVAILTNGNTYYMSDIGEILTNSKFYDYSDKYINSIKTTTNANISKKLKKKIYNLVDKLIQIFNIEGMSRIDFLYDEKYDLLYFNEINTLPGFTAISMYPKLMKEAKIDYRKLISKLLENC